MVIQDVNTQLFTENLEQELQLLNIQVAEAQVDNMLESMNLLAKKYENPLSLLGGEKQRIAIARAILKDASIIILDEATASIDPENEHLKQQAIDELSKGKTVITIAHKIGTIKNANEIIVLNEGKIIQIGNHHTLLQTSGMYKDFITIKNQSEAWRL
ncbi:ATP-binding cassette domain-containing protein [Staphylococcus shinii]|uniref:ATP-binding cassette domain-containing protein n=1 Tax=Staphylococcus shinii TaxID=2912228 RepID=UPI00057C0647|nr:ATP-binding cassette domain-containing protein [Staphylococcus shinii]